MDIHIHTQYCENYGTPESAYWKFKGGSTHVVTGFTHPLTDGLYNAATRVVEGLRPTLEYANELAEEYVIDWELAPEGQPTQDERLQLEYDGAITYPSPRVAL